MPRPNRIFIACMQCKARKIRCDGATPQCGHCASRCTACVYATARQYRGKGKKKPKGAEKRNAGLPLAGAMHSELASRVSSTKQVLLLGPDYVQSTATLPPGIPLSILDSALQVLRPNVSRVEATDGNASSSHFPSFLLPGAFESHMKLVQSSVEAANTASTPFTAMMPHTIARRLLQNSYEEMRRVLPFLGELSELLNLLGRQYGYFAAVPATIPPTSSAPAFALVNAVVALAVRHKMVTEAESPIAGIAAAYYRNATLVTHHLILQKPTRISAQALRAMAAFAGGTPDLPAKSMLLANAEQQERMMAHA